MIKKLKISNFGCLGRDVEVSFGRFTVLVGQNGSGKSTLTDVLNFVRDAMHMGLSGAVTHRGGISAVRRHSSGRPFNVSVELMVNLPGAVFATYAFELAGDRTEEFRVNYEQASIVDKKNDLVEFRIDHGKWQGPEGLNPRMDDSTLSLPAVGGDERFKALFEFLKSITVYSIFPDTLRVAQRYRPDKPMSRHGENWVSILKDQPVDTWKPDLVAALRKLTGDIEDIRVTKAASYLIVQLQHSPDSESSRSKWFEAAQESDGTLRVAGILSALLQEPPLPVVGVEEPELTVHPGALPLLVDYLRQATKRSQVIITSHSPELLDQVSPDEVRVVQRVGGVSRIAPMSSHQRETVKRGLMTLGELLVTEGVQQELGVPDLE